MASLNFRNAALAVGIAATAIAGGYAAPAPAAAQQAKPQAASQPVDAAAKAKADCLKKLDGVASKSVCSAIEGAMLKEQLEKSQKRLRESEKGLRASQAREAQADKLNACLLILKDAKSRGAVFDVQITRENACSLAAKFDQRADTKHDQSSSPKAR